MSKNNFEKYLPSLYGEGKEENNKEIEKKENSNSFKEKIKSLGKKALPYIAAASTLLALSKDTQAQRENKDNKPKQEYVLTTPDGKQIKFKSLEEELKYGKENNYIINQVDKENNTITYYYPSGEVEKYNLKDKTKIEDKKVEKEKNVKDNKDSLDIMEISLKPGHNG